MQYLVQNYQDVQRCIAQALMVPGQQPIDMPSFWLTIHRQKWFTGCFALSNIDIGVHDQNLQLYPTTEKLTSVTRNLLITKFTVCWKYWIFCAIKLIKSNPDK